MNLDDLEWLDRIKKPLDLGGLKDVARDLIAFAVDHGWGNILLECLPADENFGDAPNARLAVLINGERASFNNNQLSFETGMALAEALHAVVGEDGARGAPAFDKDVRSSDNVGEFLSLPSGRAARLRFRQSVSDGGLFISVRPSKMALDGNARLTAMWESFVIAGVAAEPTSAICAAPSVRRL